MGNAQCKEVSRSLTNQILDKHFQVHQAHPVGVP